MDEKFEELIGGFINNQVGVSDHFLTEELSASLQNNLLNLDEESRMIFAGIGNQLLKDANQKKRGDKIYWIEQETTNAAERIFLNRIEAFIIYLNESCYAGINAYEFHYALYETGSSYKRHLDQFQNNSDRKFSMIHYLNTDWKDLDGGELLIHQPFGLEKILPEIRKAVLFSSSDCEHEVCKSFRPRMSITGWLKSC